MPTDSSTSFAIITGVASGVVTSALLWVIHKIFIHVITPWYDKRLYKGVDVSGVWREKINGADPGQWTLEMTLTLMQKSYIISGNLYAKITGSQEYTNEYKVTGRITNNYVTLEYVPISNSRIGLGTFVLHVQRGGQQLFGATSFLAENTNTIGAYEELKFSKINQ